MEIILILSFLLFMGFFAAVGLSSIRVKENTTDDYLVAGRGMHPGLAALSAVSTWNSGYMFIGFIGFTYTIGYSVIWIGLASTIGQIVAWIWLYKFIQEQANERGVRSLSSLVSRVSGAPEAKLAAALSVLFLSVYAAAQLTSGGKALFAMMGWSELIGILIGFILVVAYCYAGGIRASIWTDAAQSCVMIVGSVLLCWVAMGEVGGFNGLHDGLNSQNENLTNMFPPDLKLGVTLWVFAFFLGGLGVAGQPQVVSRVMTLGTDRDRKEAMIWFFVWQTPFILLMLIIGLASRVTFTSSDFDPELGLPMMAMETLGPFWVGLILASIFAATMSTADSQVLACTAAITDDIIPKWSQNHTMTKVVTLLVALLATTISIVGQYIPGGDSVFALVVLAVYGLGGIFIPMLTIRWMGYEPDTFHSIVMMISALVAVIVWRLIGLNNEIFESVPGMGAAFAAHFIMSRTRTPDSSPLGRYAMPSGRVIGISAMIILAPMSAAEVGYFLSRSEDSGTLGGVGNYTVILQIENVVLVEDEEYIADGDVIDFDYLFTQVDREDGFHVAEVQMVWTYDETNEEADPNSFQEQAACAVNPGNDAMDSTIGELEHNGFFSTAQGDEVTGIGIVNEEFWSGFSWLVTVSGALSGDDLGNGTQAWNISGLSEGEIRENLSSSGDQYGDYALSLGVEANSGGNGQCPHSDDGEEVRYELRVILMSFEVEKNEIG
ncbi:MAG: sodium/proline symporter [Candidatus Thalassarchaeaceae archaeon]|jgi:Na+/proline symporter|nr:sodium/proline symporter [Candidatus Thalassarchaeaceae archaeon]|tara:strand:- start:41300 stop:43459 length:2160 start_codon:yes stop_codon:yes gene_type:complete